MSTSVKVYGCPLIQERCDWVVNFLKDKPPSSCKTILKAHNSKYYNTQYGKKDFLSFLKRLTRDGLINKIKICDVLFFSDIESPVAEVLSYSKLKIEKTKYSDT